MKLYQHIRLLENKGLKDATLDNLGRINVICGPNNSGKSTVLECLNNNKFFNVGLSFTDEKIEEFIQNTLQKVPWRQDSDVVNRFKEVVKQVFASGKIWYQEQMGLLGERLDSQWHHSRLPWGAPSQWLLQLFAQEFPERLSKILIPAKRKLESKKTINTSDKIEPNGQGILNFLLTAKNQIGTDEHKRYSEILNAFKEITNGHEFDIALRAGNEVELKFKSTRTVWLNADDCGLGMQDVMIILYFATSPDFDFLLIEEPENHLHPELQRRLIKYLREKTGVRKQYVLTTHSSVFLNTQVADRVFLCRITDSIQIENATSRAELLTELGYSIADNLVSDLIILCEGPSDKAPLEEFLRKMDLWEKYSIKIWALGGDIMDQHDLNAFRESKKVMAIIDNDPKSEKVRKRFCANCAALSIPVCRLKGYSLENYYKLSAIAEAMKCEISRGAHISGFAQEGFRSTKF